MHDNFLVPKFLEKKYFYGREQKESCCFSVFILMIPLQLKAFQKFTGKKKMETKNLIENERFCGDFFIYIT